MENRLGVGRTQARSDDIEARFLQGTWRQRTDLDAFGDGVNRAWIYRWEEKKEGRLPPGVFPGATGQMGKARDGRWGRVLWEGRGRGLPFVHKHEMPLIFKCSWCYRERAIRMWSSVERSGLEADFQHAKLWD